MKIRTVMPALALTSALVLAGCGDDSSMGDMDMGSGSGSTASPTTSTSESPSTPSASPSASPTLQGEAQDVMFLQMMYPHHAQATEMAALAQGRTDNQAVLDLATQIEQAQGPEMEQMAQLLEGLGQPAPSADMGAMDGMDHGSGMDQGPGSMSGMMTEEDMSALEATSGREFDQMWLSMMIEHHTGAVEMARAELDNGADPQVQQLATEIIEAQEAEITTMEELVNQPPRR